MATHTHESIEEQNHYSNNLGFEGKASSKETNLFSTLASGNKMKRQQNQKKTSQASPLENYAHSTVRAL